MSENNIPEASDPLLKKGRQYFIYLLAGINLLALAENMLLYFISSVSSGTLMIPYVYPIEVSMLIIVVILCGILLLKGARIRYLFLVAMMVLSISLAFFAVQTFQISYGFGYTVIAGCILLLGAGFYAFYNPEIVYFLKRNADLRNVDRDDE